MKLTYISGNRLWMAYKNGQLEELYKPFHASISAFPYLQEVVKAHVDRFQKMVQKEDLKKLLKTSQKIFLLIFIKCSEEFWNRESIYGFGDIQLKSLYDKVMHYR